MTEFARVLEDTIGIPAVQNWIRHAKFHAESDDRGYPTGDFDWHRFHNALSISGYRNCCNAPQFVAEHRVTETINADWWWAYREAMLAYVATYLNEAEQAA